MAGSDGSAIPFFFICMESEFLNSLDQFVAVSVKILIIGLYFL